MIVPFCSTVVRRVQRKQQAATEANLRWVVGVFLVALVWVFINLHPVLEKHLTLKIIPFIKVGQFSLAGNKP